MTPEHLPAELRAHWYKQLRTLTQKACIAEGLTQAIQAATPLGQPSLVPPALRTERRVAWLRVNELAALMRETAPWTTSA